MSLICHFLNGFSSVGRARAAQRNIRGQEFSVTVQRDGGDLNVDHCMTPLRDWLCEKCSRAYVGVERGGALGYLHLQCVIHTIAPMAAATISKNLNILLGFKDAAAVTYEQGSVMTRALSQKGLHTFLGMVGYCMKDRMQPWFDSFSIGVSQDDIQSGEALYLEHGQPDIIKNACVLSSYNILQRCYVFWKYHLSLERAPINFVTTLVRMHQTGKYVPDARWVVERSGGAMHVARIEAAWRLMTQPEIATREDVDAVYFNFAPISAGSKRPRHFHKQLLHEPEVSQSGSPPISEQSFSGVSIASDPPWVGDDGLAAMV